MSPMEYNKSLANKHFFTICWYKTVEHLFAENAPKEPFDFLLHIPESFLLRKLLYDKAKERKSCYWLAIKTICLPPLFSIRKTRIL